MTITDRLPFVGGEPTALDPFLDRAARWATSLRYRDIPKPVRRAAKAQLTSTVGAGVWTTTHPLGDRIADATESRYPSGEATFLGGSDRTPEGAAVGNAALSMALDFDGTVLGGHTGHSSVFVPLAYAEATNASGKRALVAHVAANEIAARLASAAAIGPFRGQQTAYIHSVGAAVGRAVIEDDDAETLANALGTALLQPPWPLEPPFLGANAKVWSASEPVRSGIAAVDAARAGLGGRPDLVEADGGFLGEFADLPLPEFLEGFGERWHTRAVTIKAVPGCAYVTAPVEAALDVRGRFDPGRTEIQRVDVYGSLFATEVDDLAAPYLDGPESPMSALSFTIPYNVAAALVDGEHTPRQVGKRTADEGLWTLAERVFVHHDASFTMAALESEVPVGAMLRRVGVPVIGYAAKTVGVRATVRHLPTLARFARKRPLPTDLSTADKRMGARVEVTTTDGRTLSATVGHPSGFAGKPLAEIRAVARRKCLEGLQETGLRESVARGRVEGLLGIDDADTVSLASLMDAESGAVQ
ncbi:MAG: 2-methylcitrate dehydratase PrpD [Natronomonas sp.]|jgi:2-methylcitrate dehydratase PrpD|uniref:MmgE/PrpD family protein n=1 Tax=Natronomonas sp. TaxID=2184060 RepID=UPI00398A042C